MKYFTYYGISYQVGLSSNRLNGRYVVSRETWPYGIVHTDTRYFNDTLAYDDCDDEQPSERRTRARRFLCQLFKHK